MTTMTRRIHRHPAPEWKFDDLLFSLGTIRDVHAMLKKRGYDPPSVHTIQGWRTRNSVPFYWVIPILQIGYDAGKFSDLDALRRRHEKNAA